MGRASSALITAIERLYYASHRRANIVNWLVEELGPRASTDVVLDFGGGNGHVSRELRHRIGGRYLVADVSTPVLQQAKRGPGVAPVRTSPAPRLPIKTGVLAAVVLVDVLHHVHEEGETLAELVRCLRPGGVLAIVEFARFHLATQVFRVLVRLSGRRCRFRTSSELANILRKRGLCVSVTRLDGLRYGVSTVR